MSNISNKQVVLDFYKKVIGERNASLIENYISTHYIQHSPQLPGGIEGLKTAIVQLATMPTAPQTGSPIKLVLADGDFVVLLLEITLQNAKLQVIDIFRLEDGMIIEHWDAIQALEQSLNSMPTTAIRIFTEEDVIVTQSTASWEGDPYAVYDIWWLASSKVSKHITIQQKMPADMPHNNGMI